MAKTNGRIEDANHLAKLVEVEARFQRLVPKAQSLTPAFQYTVFNSQGYATDHEKLLAFFLHLKMASRNFPTDPRQLKNAYTLACPEHCMDGSCPPCFDFNEADYDGYIQKLDTIIQTW